MPSSSVRTSASGTDVAGAPARLGQRRRRSEAFGEERAVGGDAFGAARRQLAQTLRGRAFEMIELRDQEFVRRTAARIAFAAQTRGTSR